MEGLLALVGIIVAAVALFFQQKGKEQGRRDAMEETAERIREIREEEADEEREEVRRMSMPDRVARIRDKYGFGTRPTGGEGD